MSFIKLIRNMLLILLVAYIVTLTNKNVQIYLLYEINSWGAGWDEGAIMMFTENKAEYKPVILDMLDSKQMTSYETNVTFTFAELFLNDEDVYSKLKHISENYPKKHVRCFWHDVLNNRFQNELVLLDERIDSPNQYALYQVVDNGSTCK